MQILGIIVLLTGLVLVLVAGNLSHYLPPNYQNEDDGFTELMQSMGKLLGGAGGVLIAIGIVCILVVIIHK